ncbi:nectin-2 isoform X3 [Sus scrofa]|uniref:nectin-2 isoform X3 n=1 Tax=Sus scrofa TaxID=9823 RepID=UPI0006B1C623|nr:nectin-2 isoform X3 [Sus scrofa]
MARAAALPPSRLSPPTLPLLPLLLLLLRETRAQDVRVRVAAEVRGHLGDTVELPCHLLPPAPEVRVSQVTWLRLDTPEDNQNVAIFHPQYGPSFPRAKPGKERLSFVKPGQSTGSGPGTEVEVRDATLALRGLTVEDEGNYTCEFATFPQGTSRGVTWLRVIAEPQNHAETQEVTLSLEPVPVARCVSAGGRPPARVSWLSPLDGETRESQVSGPVPGTVTVTSRFTLVPLGRADGVKITCRVEHESFKEPVLLPVTLSVRYPPEVSISGYDDNWYIGRSEATLNCDVRSKPEPTGYDWSTTSGVFPASAVAQGPKLIVHSVDKLFNTTFICTVTNAVGTGHAEQVVLVRAWRGLPHTSRRRPRRSWRSQRCLPSSSRWGPRSTARSRLPTLMLAPHALNRKCLDTMSCPPWKSGQGPCCLGPQAWGPPSWCPQGHLLRRGFPWIWRTRRRRKTIWTRSTPSMMPCPTPAPLTPTRAKGLSCLGPCMCKLPWPWPLASLF